MSYIVYINGQEVELSATTTFAQTKQVNDIANLTTRNSNYTSNIKIPRTAQNKRIMENAFNVGATTNVPYQKAVCNVIDSDTGQHVVYNGWFVLLESTAKEYSGTIYDGILDFYRSFENVTITQIGVSELNHEKNLTNVVGSWTADLPYRYILADYNGNNLTTLGDPNIDYQVPSAKVSYLWDKVFEYIGWTYTGEVFNHEKFRNLWISYPKPVSEETPVFENVATDNTTLVSNEVIYPYNGGTFYGLVTNAVFFPNIGAFNSTYYTQTTGAIVAGLYRFRFSPQTLTYNNGVSINTTGVISIYTQNVNTNQFSSIIDLDITNGNFLDLNLNLGDRVFIIALSAQSSPTSTTILTISGGENTIDYISGFSLGFDEAFIDYKVSDFVREIIIRFGLTPFKDKYSNTVKFLTLAELLQNTNVTDWTDKFSSKLSEKYTFGNYAKRNTFAYSYNDDELKHNNGSLSISDENLKEEITILNSQIYSPERLRNAFLGGCNTYKIWEKEIKDDETVEYKDLDGRFYFLRADRVDSSITIGSEVLGDTETNAYYYRESYYRLPFSEILFDWYAPITAIFNKARLIQAEIYLKPIDIYNFDFSKLYYIGQLGSYYIVNKINNFVKGKPTKVELIEVDYFTETQVVNPPNPDYTVVIGEPTLDACEITLPVTTDFATPVAVTINVYEGTFDIFGSGIVYQQIIMAEPITGFLFGGNVTFSVEQLPFTFYGYKFQVSIPSGSSFITFNSNLSEVVNLDGSCYVEPTYPTTLTLDSAVYVGRFPNFPFADNFRYTIEYSHTGMPSGEPYILYIEFNASLFGNPTSWGNYLVFNKTEGEAGELNMTFDIQGIYTQPTAIRLRIQAVTSNEIDV